MFTALILACVGFDKPVDTLTCQVFKSEISFPKYDQCLEALGYGISTAEERGWYVRDYVCFDWNTKNRGDSL